MSSSLAAVPEPEQEALFEFEGVPITHIVFDLVSAKNFPTDEDVPWFGAVAGVFHGTVKEVKASRATDTTGRRVLIIEVDEAKIVEHDPVD